MAENSPRRSSRDNQVRKHFISECRDSRIIVAANFSPNILRIYRRHFDGVSRAAYLLRFYCRVGPGNNVERELTKEIIGLIDEVKANVQKKIAVADQILNNESVKVSKSHFETVNATIIDPLANQFLKTLVLTQELDEKLSALWLACLLDDEQKLKALSEIDSDLKSIQAKTRALFVGVRTRVHERNQAKQLAGENFVDQESVENNEGASVENGESELAKTVSEAPEKQTEKAKSKATKAPSKQEESATTDSGEELETA